MLLWDDASTTTRLHTNSFEATTNRRLREDDLVAYVGGIIIHSQKRRRIQLLRPAHERRRYKEFAPIKHEQLAIE